jgi:hypothetical protein
MAIAPEPGNTKCPHMLKRDGADGRDQGRGSDRAVETGTGTVYRFPPEALIACSSPVVRRENQDGGLLVQLSRDPFITTFEARMLAAESSIKPNF